MEKKQNILESLFEKATDYVETNVELLKLKAIDKSSDITSSLIAGIVLLLIGLLFFILLNIGIAFWIGDLLGKVYYGFFIVAGFYLIVGLIFHFTKHKLVKQPLADLIIKKLLS